MDRAEEDEPTVSKAMPVIGSTPLPERVRAGLRRRAARLLTGSAIATSEALEEQQRQMEAIAGLYATLRPGRPLPPMSGWAASPAVLLELCLTVMERRPSTVVELGSGTSTVVLGRSLQALGERGHLHSFDHDPRWAERTAALVRDHHLEDVVTIHVCPLGPVDVAPMGLRGGPARWYQGATIPSGIGLAFIDGPPSGTGAHARFPALPLLADDLADGALVVLDDADRDDEREIVSEWRRRYPGLVELSGEAGARTTTLRWSTDGSRPPDGTVGTSW